MSSTAESSPSFANKVSNWILHILKARCLEGAGGLYFRTAEAVANVIAAHHTVLLVPSCPEKLRVAGCWGMPTAMLGEFPVTRGIIGRVFRDALQSKSYVIIDDVSKDTDYYCFDEQVQSELVVPIFDAHRKTVLAILNLESHLKEHFKREHAETIFRIAEIMVEYRDCLLEREKIKKRSECFYTILENIPDELLVIDKKFKPIYANKVKREKMPDLAKYFQNLTGDPLEGFLSCINSSETVVDATCHSLIEGQENVCSGCVCDKAIRLERAIQGVVYKPHNPSPVVELSAAPLFSNGHKVGCVEIARIVHQREKVLGLTPNLFKGYDLYQFLQRLTNLLNENLGYDRVRLYLMKEDQNSLKGVTYSGPHHKITKTEFGEIEIGIPTKLKSMLIESRKASLLGLEGSEESDECFGYWRIGLSRQEMSNFIDPHGCLELEDVTELAAVPIATEKDRWIFFLDSKYHRERRFTSDDLQALTAFSIIASTALEMVYQNKLRFRFAVLGETTLGLRHTLASFLRPEQQKTQVLKPLHEALRLGKQYVQSHSTTEANGAVATILGLISDLATNMKRIPPKGKYFKQVTQLKSMLQDKHMYVPSEDVLFELARLGPPEQSLSERWFEALTTIDRDIFWRLVGDTVRIVTMLRNLAQVTGELGVFNSAFKTIMERDIAEIPMDCNINELVLLALQSSGRRARKKKVEIHATYYLKPLLVNVKRGDIFLALLMLLHNAVDAAGSATGRRWIKVSTERNAKHRQASISISNNGTKIPEMDWDKIFVEPFSHKEDGTGFGLVFAHDWIEANDGRIIFDRNPKSEFTNFSIVIPLNQGIHRNTEEEAATT